MELRPFDVADAAIVAGWPTSPDEAAMWCGRRDVDAEVVAGWSAEPDVTAFTLVDHGDPIGYGELWIDHDEAGVELARLIVAPSRRGAGVGRVLVAALAAQALRHYPMVFLRVHPANTRALRCYAGAGFTQVSADRAGEWNNGQPVAYVWLRLDASIADRGGG